jgi:nitrous oxide reductase
MTDRSQASPTPANPLKRRGVLLGAAAATGAAVVAVKLGPGAPAEVVATPAAAKPEKGGGYRVSEHVLRYYQTTRV